MKASCLNLSEQTQMQVESPVEKKCSNLKARPLLLLSVLLFMGYLGNILLSLLSLQYGVAVLYLDNVWEFVMLFGAAAGSILFVLLNESTDS